MNSKGALKFVCIDGWRLMRALSGDDGLVPILERIWRLADETGEAILPVSPIWSLKILRCSAIYERA